MKSVRWEACGARNPCERDTLKRTAKQRKREIDDDKTRAVVRYSNRLFEYERNIRILFILFEYLESFEM